MDRRERWYRRALCCYPSSFRLRYGDDIVATLLDASALGRHWPDPAELASLVWHGLAARFVDRRPAVRQLWVQGLRVAGSVALATLAAIGVTVGWRALAYAAHAQWSTAFVSAGASTDARVLVFAGALGWPASLWLTTQGRSEAARRVCAAATSSVLVGSILAWAHAGHGRPSGDLLGTVVGLTVLVLTALNAEDRSSSRHGLTHPHAGLVLSSLIAVSFAALTWGHPLATPGPWASAGRITGVGTTTVAGGLVLAWLVATVVTVAMARQDPRPLAATTLLGLVPLLTGVGYAASSAALSTHPLMWLVAARAPLIAAVTVGLVALVGLSSATVVRRAALA